MGKLVHLEGRLKSEATKRPPQPTEAQIIIFTGVRYERQPGTGTPTKPTASSGGKRKRG